MPWDIHHESELKHAVCDNVTGSKDYDVKWNNPAMLEQIAPILTHLWKLKTLKQNKRREQWSLKGRNQGFDNKKIGGIVLKSYSSVG